MNENLAARIRALPEPIHGELSVVPGPGWLLQARRVEGAPYAPELRLAVPRLLPSGDAWWPANPARAVAVVTGEGLWWAHQEISNWLYAQYDNALGTPNDDHAAALAIIEAHAARADAPRQTVTNLGKVGEVINIQGPVTLSIGADGVKVVR